MGNCCTATKSAHRGAHNPHGPPSNLKPISKLELEKSEKSAGDASTVDSPAEKRLARLNDLGLFRTQSFIERKYGGKQVVENDMKLKALIKDQQTKASEALLKNYKALEVDLGAGAFSNVFMFQSRQNPSMKYAVKIMFKEDLSPDVLELVNEEVAILAMLDHPNIVKYQESYEDESNLYIVMEVLEEANELQKVINDQKQKMDSDKSKANESLFAEENVCRIMRMLMSGIHHIHSNNVVHRDLKAENCLLDKHMQLRIIDFGLSKMVHSSESGQMLLGTPYYIAPEVHNLQGENEAYKQPLDCWSAGILMYNLVSGEYPFTSPDLADKICTQYVEFPSLRFSKVSQHAKDLIRALLVKDPAKRMTAQESLDHAFFKQLRNQENEARKSEILRHDIFQQLSGYKSQSQLKKAALNLLVRSTIERRGSEQTDEVREKIEMLRLQFQRIDLDGSGCIDASELSQAMKEVDIGVEDSAIDKIIAEIDYVGNQKINYTEFLAVTLNLQETLSEEMLHRLFKRFDVDDTNFISKENLIDAFKRLGRSDISLDQVTQMISVHDIAKDGQVSFAEFKKIFEEDQELTTLQLTQQDSKFNPLVIPMTPSLPPRQRKMSGSLPDEILEEDYSNSRQNDRIPRTEQRQQPQAGLMVMVD